MAATSQRQKIAILGGGLGSLATALELTDPANQPDWKERYDITVYQLGWRLGGKGASGRGACERIEEHGLHIWMGFYENAFRAMQQVYKELNRAPNLPLATWDAAFKPHNYIVIAENINDVWKNWRFDFPANSAIPGVGGELPTLWNYIQLLIGWMHDLFKSSSHAQKPEPPHDHNLLHWLETLAKEAAIAVVTVGVTIGEKLLLTLLKFVESLDRDPNNHSAKDHHTIIRLLEEFMQGLEKEVENEIDKNDELRRLFILLDLAAAIAIGLLKDGVLFHENGLDKLDEDDLQEWLKKNGAADISCDITKSGIIKGLYDLVFAYRNGELSRPSFAAGVALRCIFRIVFTYKGAIFWKMQAGMGDTIFAPIYQVLKNRGVKFEFFHRVKNLSVAKDENGKPYIAAIRMGRQVNIVNAQEYNPLKPVLNLPCWPSAPLYDQIVEAEKLKAGNINLESFWTPWQDVEERTLNAGKDFDRVVLGISLGSLPYICPELIAADDRWKAMLDNVETVRTLAMQLWFKPDLKALGWEQESPVMDAYVDPLNTWADMSQLISREIWPAGNTPQNIAYFCGQMIGGIPPSQDHEAPQKAYEEVKAIGFNWLNQNIGYLWPNAVSPNNPHEMNWDLLCVGDAKNPKGNARFDEQFFRANIDPSERYVLSVAQSTKFRLKTNASGFDNLYLTGDWIDNGFNAGCVEATVMAGMLAANAICGYPKIDDIIGYAGP